MSDLSITIPESKFSKALEFWRSRLSMMIANEINVSDGQPLLDIKRTFLEEELSFGEELISNLESITEDPLTTLGIITSMFSLLFNSYQYSSPIVLMMPFLQGENNNGSVFPLLLPIPQEKTTTLKEYLSNSIQVIEDCFNNSNYPVEVLAKEEFGWKTTVVSNILIFSELNPAFEKEDQFDMKLKIDLKNNKILFQYDPNIFPEYRAKLIKGHLHQILSAFNNFDVPVSSIDILTPHEVKHLMGLNPFPVEKDGYTLIDLLNKTVKEYPDRAALLFKEKTITYKELDVKSSQLAQYLQQELGVRTGSTVALMAEKSELIIVAILGILKSGAAYVPVDPTYPKERIEYLLTASCAETLITTSGFLFDVPFFTGNIFALDLQLNDLPEVSENFNISVNDQSLAYIIFTSGSTGRPKGVEISHASLFNYLKWASEYYFHHNVDGGGFALFTPVSFDLTVTSIFIPLIRGKQIVIFEDGDAGEILSEIFSEKGNIDTLKLTPSHISLLAGLPASNTNVRTLIVGGEALRNEHVRMVKNKWPNILIFNEYGPTEATVGCTVTAVNTDSISIGRPIANTSIYILDQHMRLLPKGATGEIYIGGTGLAKGYRNQPEQTESAFVKTTFINGERLYRTGDFGAWQQDANLKYLGRSDNQLKIRGYRIETGEIENILLEHLEVNDAAVVPRFNNKTNSTTLAAFYTASDGTFLKAEDLERVLVSKLPLYMVPSLIMQIEKMPLTPNFKIDRQKLSEMEMEKKNETDFIAPVSEIEQSLAKIFGEALGSENVSMSDNFFAMGGDSIIGIQIVSQANRNGITITLKQLFNQHSIAGLASVAKKTAPVIADQGVVSGNIDLTPIHKWFFEQQFNHISHYNQSVILNVDASFEPRYMEKALLKVLGHHDVFRMRVRQNGNDYEEYIPLSTTILPNFTIEDFTEVAETAAFKSNLLADMAQVQANLDIFKGPILLARYYNLGNNKESILFLAAHHLIIDGFSWRILLEDLSFVYKKLVLGHPFELPKKTASYKDWAAAAMSYSSSATLAKEIPFWVDKQMVSGSTLPLDINKNNKENTVKNSLVYSVQLDADITRSLISTAHNAYNTNINDLLLAALVTAFNSYTGESSLLIAMEGHGREDIFDNIDVSRTIGWFTSIYPVLLNLENIKGSAKVITALKEQLRRIPDNGIGYGLLKYGSQGNHLKRSLADMPQPEVSFNYLGQSAQALSLNSDWKISTLGAGNDQNGDAKRNFLIEINAIVIDDKLLVDWVYCSQLHSDNTIKKLATTYIDALKELVAHCLDTTTGGYTPSDFPEAGLEQDQLDQLISQFNLLDQ